jgi:hypothetical protein
VRVSQLALAFIATSMPATEATAQSANGFSASFIAVPLETGVAVEVAKTWLGLVHHDGPG